MENKALEQELQNIIKHCSIWAEKNFKYAHITFTVSIFGSFSASVLAAGDETNKYIMAIISALPGVMLLINNKLQFEERTKWFWRKARMTERYYRQLRDVDNPKIEELSSKFSDESEKLELEWPSFGVPPKQPNERGTDGKQQVPLTD